jgi:RND family efflux transporter MFP subunit
MDSLTHSNRIKVVLCCFAVLAFDPSRAAANDEIAVPVETATAVVQTASAPLRVPGTIVSRQDASVAPEVSGRLNWLAEVGDRIVAGEPLARLSDTTWRIQLRSDEAEIQRLKVNLDYLRRQVDRFERLADTNSMAASEVDRLTTEMRMLEQDHAAATSRRDRTAYDLEQAIMRAPFTGVVVERNADIGEVARTGEPIMRIVNMSALEVVARAPMDVARHASPGDLVWLESNTTRLATSMRALVPVGDERSRGIEVRVTLPPGDWLVGEAVRIEIETGAGPAQVAIPRDALVLRDKEVYVFKVLADASAKQVAVRVGNGGVDMVSVEGDIGAGDRVVIRGAERLKDGQSVRVLGDRAVARRS